MNRYWVSFSVSGSQINFMYFPYFKVRVMVWSEKSSGDWVGDEGRKKTVEKLYGSTQYLTPSDDLQKK